jgi:hypothetical protein
VFLREPRKMNSVKELCRGLFSSLTYWNMLAKPSGPRHFQGMDREDPTSDPTKRDGSGRKPTPIRDVVGESGTTPKRPSEEGPERREPGRGQRQERPARSSPLSVRDTVDGAAHEPTAVQELPSCHFEVEGVKWIARLSGRASTGSVPNQGAPLLHLTFFKSADPLVAVVETLLPGESFDQLFEADLSEVLATARAVPRLNQSAESSSKS